MASMTWNQLYAGAKAAGHPDPERFATTSLKARERALELKAQRRKVIMTNHKPKNTEAVTAAPTAKKATSGKQCKAQTLEGKQCKFKATCGEFCKKHSAALALPQWHKVAEDRLTGATFKGYICATREQAKKVFGEPNGSADEAVDMTWRLDFGGVVARVYFRRSEPSLHVSGTSVEAVAKVRMAMAL